MAEWIAEGEPSLDVWEMDIRRFGPHYRSPSYTLKRAKEVYETYYDIRYPGEERQAGRPLRVSSAYAWHRDHGAVFGEKSGWERVNWYESNATGVTNGSDPNVTPRGWAGQNWSPAIGVEHVACRERAALFDESSFAKMEIAGPGAAEFLEGLCDNRVARDVGAITYTQMLNRRGGIECDFTVTRVEEELFSIVTGTAFGTHDLAWIRRHLPDGGSVRVSDVTARWSCFALWGPRARDILAPLHARLHSTSATCGCATSRSATSRCARCASRSWGSSGGSCTARRSTALGCGERCGRPASRTAWSPADTARSTRCASRRATGCGPPTSRRTSTRARPAWASASRPTREYIGREALDAPPRGALRCLLLEDPSSIALGNEPVRIGGEIRGRVTSGGYGHTIGRSIAYAWVPPGVEVGEQVAVDIFGEWVRGEVAAEPLYDPSGARVRD